MEIRFSPPSPSIDRISTPSMHGAGSKLDRDGGSIASSGCEFGVGGFRVMTGRLARAAAMHERRRNGESTTRRTSIPHPSIDQPQSAQAAQSIKERCKYSIDRSIVGLDRGLHALIDRSRDPNTTHNNTVPTAQQPTQAMPSFLPSFFDDTTDRLCFLFINLQGRTDGGG